jgi:DinB family protein
VDVVELLAEIYGRIPPAAAQAVDGLDVDQLRRSPSGANPVGWLVWHLSRVQDDHIAGAFGLDQVWERDGWAGVFGLPEDCRDIGYGHSADQVAAFRAPSAAVLVDYLKAVHEQTRSVLTGLVPQDLDRVVDHSYRPPVTLGVRLVSVAEDCLQHAGQAAYARGAFL